MIPSNKIVHRKADGRLIRGTWRPAFIRNGGTHFLTELYVYADGIVDAWGLLTLAEFERKLASGWVATSLPEGGRASAHHLAAWRFQEPQTWYTPELLLAEVRDTIDELNGRPDSTGRCRALIDVFMADRTEANRLAVRAAYLAIPETTRRYALGDMDLKDQPLRVLAAGVGGRDEEIDETVTREDYEEAIGYFAAIGRWGPAPAGERTAGKGTAGRFSSVHIPHSYPQGSDDPGKEALRITYPASFDYEGTTYPTVAHAFLALSTTDPAIRAAAAAADTPGRAKRLTADAPRPVDWDRTRPAVMARLLDAKFAQHPALAAILLATGDETILYDEYDDTDFWGDNGGRGRNWLGRLLELTRASLPAAPAPSAPEDRTK
ncbi:NADAR family protein [Streptomyces sp. NPDC020875]|uniref:NADAR family protein n=1 Tax=Streptomyces sp. NPDC020875 TaxID=3154898 RepID=UPI0033C3ECF1